MSITYHEALYRGSQTMERLRQTRITVCGAGALGANIAESLVRSGAELVTVIDRDRVEERNLSTQPYQLDDVGAPKALILSHNLFRVSGRETQAVSKELTELNVRKLLQGADLVVDTFDNSLARGLVTEYCSFTGTPCLHAGLSDAYSEVLWNDVYRVPSEARDDICDYPLARNLVMLTVSVACEALLRYFADGVKENRTITLADLAIQPYR